MPVRTRSRGSSCWKKLLRIVLRADLEHEALAALEHDAGRPDLDLDGNDLAGRQLLDLVVGVERPVGRRPRGIELAVRDAQPAVRRGDRAGRRASVPGNVTSRAVAAELADDREEIGVVDARRDPQPELDGAGDLGVVLERARSRTWRSSSRPPGRRVVGDRARRSRVAAARACRLAASRYYSVHCVRAIGHSFS